MKHGDVLSLRGWRLSMRVPAIDSFSYITAQQAKEIAAIGDRESRQAAIDRACEANLYDMNGIEAELWIVLPPERGLAIERDEEPAGG